MRARAHEKTVAVPLSKTPKSSFYSQIRSADEKDWQTLVDLVIQEKWTVKQLQTRMIDAKKLRSGLDLLWGRIPRLEELHKDLKDFYYPKKYLKVYKDFDEELKIRTWGGAKWVYKYLPAKEYTIKEAKQYASEHHGQYLDTIKYRRVGCLDRTVEEIRARYDSKEVKKKRKTMEKLESKKRVQCPRCRSEDVQFLMLTKDHKILPDGQKLYQCNDCNLQWNRTEQLKEMLKFIREKNVTSGTFWEEKKIHFWNSWFWNKRKGQKEKRIINGTP